MNDFGGSTDARMACSFDHWIINMGCPYLFISIDFDAIVSPVLRFKIRVWIGLPAFINVWLSLVEPHWGYSNRFVVRPAPIGQNFACS